jgi:hypothetical protein
MMKLQSLFLVHDEVEAFQFERISRFDEGGVGWVFEVNAMRNSMRKRNKTEINSLDVLRNERKINLKEERESRETPSSPLLVVSEWKRRFWVFSCVPFSDSLDRATAKQNTRQTPACVENFEESKRLPSAYRL